MGRIRYMKPDFFKDEDLADLPFEARLLFAGLWGIADKEGRLEDRPKRIKVEVFPYDDVDVDKNLDLLSMPKKTSGLPFIERYVVEEQGFIQIVKWKEHQKPHHTEKDSILPPRIIENTKKLHNGDGEGNGDGKGNGKAARSESDVKEPLFNGVLTVTEEKTNKISDIKLKTQFDTARKLYKGQKRGLETEFSCLRNKHNDYREIVQLLYTSIQAEIVHKEKLVAAGQFCPEWPHFSTWLNQRRWEQEFPEVVDRAAEAEKSRKAELLRKVMELK